MIGVTWYVTSFLDIFTTNMTTISNGDVFLHCLVPRLHCIASLETGSVGLDSSESVCKVATTYNLKEGMEEYLFDANDSLLNLKNCSYRNFNLRY